MDLPDQQEQRVTEDQRYLHDKSKTTVGTQESLKIDCSLYTVSNFLFFKYHVWFTYISDIIGHFQFTALWQ